MPFDFKKCAAKNGKVIESLYEIQPCLFGDAQRILEVYFEIDFLMPA